MNKKDFEIINHTADIGIKVRGKTLEELFLNSAKGLYSIMEIEFKEEKGKKIIEMKDNELEGLLIKFLNELIYYIESKRVAGIINNISIKENLEFQMSFEMKMYSISNLRKEVKAATYHNLKIEKKDEIYETTIIFDL